MKDDQQCDQNKPENAAVLVDPSRPKGWAPIPTLTVPNAQRLENLLRALWRPDATSWISSDGRHYVVPGRHGDGAVVDIYEGGPGQWGCNCSQAHDASATENLCDAIIQVAILRGDFVRRKER